jgi:putative Mg2+ transporter-C (MgtC) family protein
MLEEHAIMAVRLLGAVLVGGVIGFERSFHGRPAGFRTHTLVCLASTVLMLVTVYEWQWMPAHTAETIRMDPTRMAQGIMTGIGFLGAGVIFKEGLSVRGLTTAASVWITAALGILIGIGFYFPAAVTTLLVLFTLSAFRWIEAKTPTQVHARLDLAFRKDSVKSEANLREELSRHGFTIAQLSYRMPENAEQFEYRMTIRTTNAAKIGVLASALREDRALTGFRISPAGD